MAVENHDAVCHRPAAAQSSAKIMDRIRTEISRHLLALITDFLHPVGKTYTFLNHCCLRHDICLRFRAQEKRSAFVRTPGIPQRMLDESCPRFHWLAGCVQNLASTSTPPG